MIRILAIATAAALLAGCTARDEFDPWGQRGVIRPEGSATLSRITGGSPSITPLLPEPGNVWPVEEAPRATLMNPDEQQRGVQPGNVAAIPPPQPLFRQDSVEFERGSPQLPPPGPRPTRDLPPPTAALPPVLNSAPPTNDRIRILPTGETVVQPGGSGPATFTTPGGGSGIAIPQGPNNLLIGPGGRVRQVPN